MDGQTDRQTYNTSCKVALTTENDLNSESQIFPYFSLISDISALKEKNKILIKTHLDSFRTLRNLP